LFIIIFSLFYFRALSDIDLSFAEKDFLKIVGAGSDFFSLQI